jgi:hypothetical protein
MDTRQKGQIEQAVGQTLEGERWQIHNVHESSLPVET